MRTRIVIGIGVGLLLTWLLFRNTDWNAVVAAFRASRPWFLLLSVALAVAGNLARVQRWSYAVRATCDARLHTVFSAAQIGLLFNVLLPLRIGEAVRAVVLSRSTAVSASRAVALVAVDRVADMVALLPILFVAVAVFPTDRVVTLPVGSASNAATVSIAPAAVWGLATSVLALIVIAVALLWIIYMHHLTVVTVADAVLARRWPRLAARVGSVIVGFNAGMQVFRSAGDVSRAMMFSLAAWLCGILSLAAVMTAFGVDYPWSTPFLLQAMIALFVTVPIAPGLVGQFHAAIVVGLLLAVPAAARPVVGAVALTSHVISVGVLLVLGVIGMTIERMTIPSIWRRGVELRAARMRRSGREVVRGENSGGAEE